MKLCAGAQYILDTLERAGYRADIVGGPVRDFLLGKQPSDYDITTSALPEDVKRVFSAHRTVDTGIRHGTVSVILDGEQYEITTYRTDGEYKDSRHPESVTFTAKIEDDLSRRDFTVNAMAYSPKYGITDIFGGERDLGLGIIRAVGEPAERFREDALRILRAVRFASVLGFKIDDATASALRALAPTLEKISAERIFTEWTKLLSGDGAYDVISEFASVIEVILPEIACICLPDRERFLAADPYIRHLSLFAMLPDSPHEAFSRAMLRLRSPTAYRCDGAATLAVLSDSEMRTASDIGRLLFALGPERAQLLASLKILLGTESDDAAERIRAYLDGGLPYRISDLAVCGDDIKALGISGREIGVILRSLILDVIDGKLENSKEALIERAKHVSER